MASGQPVSPDAQVTVVLSHQMWSLVVFFQSGCPSVAPPPKPYGYSSNDQE